MWRLIFGVFGGVVVLRVAAAALTQVYRERPFSTLLGCALVVAVLIVLGAKLLGEQRRGEITLRQASMEYGPRYDPPPEYGGVEHVEHHVTVRVEHAHTVEHVHRYEGGRAHTVPGPVVDGEVVARRAIEQGRDGNR